MQGCRNQIRILQHTLRSWEQTAAPPVVMLLPDKMLCTEVQPQISKASESKMTEQEEKYICRILCLCVCLAGTFWLRGKKKTLWFNASLALILLLFRSLFFLFFLSFTTGHVAVVVMILRFHDTIAASPAKPGAQQ